MRPEGAARPAVRALLIAAFVQACATENVTEVVVVSVTVQPGNAAVETGGTVKFEAIVADDTGDTQFSAPASWSSDSPEVVFVDQSGIARALATGIANVEATYRGMTGSASVLVVPGPSLVIEPGMVSMAGDVRGDGPSAETVLVSNGGLGRLTGLGTSVRYESGGREGWLEASLSADTTPATLTLALDVGAMPSGVYDAVVLVSSGENDELSASLPVRLSLAGITLRETGGGTSVEEGGRTDSFSVVLDLDPGAEVRLSVAPRDRDQIDIDPSRLTFGTTNWSTPQTVTVSAVDDRVVQGDRTTEIIVSVDDAEQTPYAIVKDRVLQVIVEDDDVADFLVTETGGWTSAREGGFTDTLIVVLTAEPMSDVVFSAWTDDLDDAILEPGELTFTPRTWDVPQLLIFTAVEDGRRDGFGFRKLSIVVDPSRSDPAFHGLSETIDAVTFDGDRLGSRAPGPGS